MQFSKISFFALAAILLAGCGNNDEALREAALKSLDSLEQARATEVHAPMPEPIRPTDHIEPKEPTTKIDYQNQEKFKFGKVNEGEKVTHDFEFKNAGTEPLLITNCKASCGCTVPEWSKEPVAPGKMGKIHVVFDTEHKTGTQLKTVTVTANTDPSHTVIALVGEVIPK